MACSFSLNPVAILLYPAAHSLQYLAVVWRYLANREGAQENADQQVSIGGLALCSRKTLGMGLIVAFSILGSIIGFVVLPMLLASMAPAGRQDPLAFYAMAWVFINVHHYFLDNVIWRKENPDIEKYLFNPSVPEPARQGVGATVAAQ